MCVPGRRRAPKAETTHGTSKINARAARSARDRSVRTVEPRVSPPRPESGETDTGPTERTVRLFPEKYM